MKTQFYDVLVVAHGDLPPKACLKALANASRRLIALDGAADRLIAMGLRPHVILGDLDSISASALKLAPRHGTRIVQIKEQKTSDLGKGLQFCKERNWKRIAVTGFLGNRLDHSLNAFGVLSKFHDLEMTLITSQSIARVLHGHSAFKCAVRPGQQISLMPLPVTRGVTLTGVKWPLHSQTLRQTGLVSLSNKATHTMVTVRQASGCSLFIAQRRRGQIELESVVARRRGLARGT
jgi:thiamine pyrophosphokinase